MIDFKGSQFEREVILWGVRWYVAYPISYRQLEEMMGERGVAVDHSTLNRWVIKYAPEIEKQFRRQRPVGKSWRFDETYVKIKGKWAYLYRAVLRSVPSKWRRARDEGLRLTRSLITWMLERCKSSPPDARVRHVPHGSD
jgi:transposase-like protein